MQKIKRTDVKRSGGFKRFIKIVFVIFVFAVLFLVGFLAASFFTEVLS